MADTDTDTDATPDRNEGPTTLTVEFGLDGPHAEMVEGLRSGGVDVEREISALALGAIEQSIYRRYQQAKNGGPGGGQ
jgi:hypothetical protein